MKEELQILMLEDVAADAELVRHELQAAGLVCQLHVVGSKAEFLRELHRHPPDVILSDHGLPTFDGFTALAIARIQCPDTPFIFVTGSMGEAMTIETFEHGAADYVLKDRLSNLGPAIRRSLREAEERVRRRRVDAERDQVIEELQVALTRVEALRGLLIWP